MYRSEDLSAKFHELEGRFRDLSGRIKGEKLKPLFTGLGTGLAILGLLLGVSFCISTCAEHGAQKQTQLARAEQGCTDACSARGMGVGRAISAWDAVDEHYVVKSCTCVDEAQHAVLWNDYASGSTEPPELSEHQTRANHVCSEACARVNMHMGRVLWREKNMDNTEVTQCVCVNESARRVLWDDTRSSTNCDRR